MQKGGCHNHCGSIIGTIVIARAARGEQSEHNGYVCMRDWSAPLLALAQKKCGFQSPSWGSTIDGISNDIPDKYGLQSKCVCVYVCE